MARSDVAQFYSETDFDPLHPDKAPICDRCRRIAYTVHQAVCCGAYFCESCKTIQLQSAPIVQSLIYQTCPKCHGKLGQINYDYNETQKRICFKVYCRNKRSGCSHEDEIGRMNLHLLNCQYEKVSCEHERCVQKVFRKDLQRHHETCPDRIIQCQFCRDYLRAGHLQEYHLYNGCQDFPKDCPNKCGSKVTDRELSKHKETCSHEPLGCLFNKYGCAQTVRRQQMNEHVLDYKHIELLLKEIDKSQQTIQSLQAEVQLLKNNYNRIVFEDIGKLKKLQTDLQAEVAQNHKKLSSQISTMERDFQFHKKAFEAFKNDCKTKQDGITSNIENKWINPIKSDLQLHKESIENFMIESKMMQDRITQANTLPFKFIVNNTDELALTDKGHQSPYFYTECRRHKLRLTIFPGGKGTKKGDFMSVWLHRINNFGVKNDKLPEGVKIKVVIVLISQLPNSTPDDNYVFSIDAVVHQEQEEVIFKKDDFIAFRELDHTERRTRVFSRCIQIQYKMDNTLLFQVLSAVEATL